MVEKNSWKRISKTHWVRKRGRGLDEIMLTKNYNKNYWNVQYKQSGSYWVIYRKSKSLNEAVRIAKNLTKSHLLD